MTNKIQLKYNEVRPVILKDIDYVALILIINKERDLLDEYQKQIPLKWRELGFKYWLFVFQNCLFNMLDISVEICSNDAAKLAIKRQLLGMIVTLNPQVYHEDFGWDF